MANFFMSKKIEVRYISDLYFNYLKYKGNYSTVIDPVGQASAAS